MNGTEGASALVETRIVDRTAIVTLHRPETLNSMNNDLMIGIRESIERVEADESVRVVVLTGAGRGFCSGADLSAVQPPGAADESPDAAMDDVLSRRAIGRVAVVMDEEARRLSFA